MFVEERFDGGPGLGLSFHTGLFNQEAYPLGQGHQSADCGRQAACAAKAHRMKLRLKPARYVQAQSKVRNDWSV